MGRWGSIPLAESSQTEHLRRMVACMALRSMFDVHATDDVQFLRQVLAELSHSGRLAHMRELAALRWTKILLEGLPEDVPERHELNLLWREMYRQAVEV
jgi:hypothetical protein